MSSESVGGLEDVMMGNVKEEASESNEQIQARIAAAKARIAKIKKDEKKDTNFDHQLAKILKDFTPDQLDFVIFLIDHEITSLTILAILSLVNDESGKICYVEFKKYIENRADFSNTNLPEALESKISYWWTFIYGADHISNVRKLKELKTDTSFIKHFSQGLNQLLKKFLEINGQESFDIQKLEVIIEKYRDLIFEDQEKK